MVRMPTFPSSFPPELNLIVSTDNSSIVDSIEEMVTPCHPIHAPALSTDNVPGPLHSLHKLSHLTIITLWTSIIIISILQRWGK